MKLRNPTRLHRAYVRNATMVIPTPSRVKASLLKESIFKPQKEMAPKLLTGQLSPNLHGKLQTAERSTLNTEFQEACGAPLQIEENKEHTLTQIIARNTKGSTRGNASKRKTRQKQSLIAEHYHPRPRLDHTI